MATIFTYLLNSKNQNQQNDIDFVNRGDTSVNIGTLTIGNLEFAYLLLGAIGAGL